MDWDIDFITYDNFKKHVKNTINHYGEKLESYDIKRFNKNIIDPIKMIFDKAVYGNAIRRTITRLVTSINASSTT